MRNDHNVRDTRLFYALAYSPITITDWPAKKTRRSSAKNIPYSITYSRATLGLATHHTHERGFELPEGPTRLRTTGDRCTMHHDMCADDAGPCAPASAASSDR